MIKAVVFDFDGLIMDTETFEYYSFRDLLQDYGLELPFQLYSSRIGGHVDSFDPYRYLQERCAEPLDRELLRELRREKFAALFANEHARPGVEDYLCEAKEAGLLIGLASSAPKDWVVPLLDKLRLTSYFGCIRTFENATRVKPDPELYLQVLQFFDIAPQEAVAFEDSPNGALAAKRAGMRCVIVPNELTRGLTFPEVDLRLNSMRDLSLNTMIRLLEQA
ncbi:HAD family hydrolase [Paenibacillus thalictri]|uniref:HAD family hydrolase n=2 Tax=Paenibacillus thalictri TaxID=2527873 RepID=A0A4V2J415_9BACL|nr:HAD family hydrolase [Paenibacillus thalictri]TBL77253.1 HAD family hydrolase [Paenibacillus thalictri]